MHKIFLNFTKNESHKSYPPFLSTSKTIHADLCFALPLASVHCADTSICFVENAGTLSPSRTFHMTNSRLRHSQINRWVFEQKSCVAEFSVWGRSHERHNPSLPQCDPHGMFLCYRKGCRNRKFSAAFSQ